MELNKTYFSNKQATLTLTFAYIYMAFNLGYLSSTLQFE